MTSDDVKAIVAECEKSFAELTKKAKELGALQIKSASEFREKELNFGQSIVHGWIDGMSEPAAREKIEIPFYNGSEHGRISVYKDDFIKQFNRERGLTFDPFANPNGR